MVSMTLINLEEILMKDLLMPVKIMTKYMKKLPKLLKIKVYHPKI